MPGINLYHLLQQALCLIALLQGIPRQLKGLLNGQRLRLAG
jgi:hypothetical protein